MFIQTPLSCKKFVTLRTVLDSLWKRLKCSFWLFFYLKSFPHEVQVVILIVLGQPQLIILLSPLKWLGLVIVTEIFAPGLQVWSTKRTKDKLWSPSPLKLDTYRMHLSCCYASNTSQICPNNSDNTRLDPRTVEQSVPDLVTLPLLCVWVLINSIKSFYLLYSW